MSERVAELKFEVTLNDGSKLFIYQLEKKLYGVCTVAENKYGFKLFKTRQGLKRYIKVKYGIEVRFDV